MGMGCAEGVTTQTLCSMLPRTLMHPLTCSSKHTWSRLQSPTSRLEARKVPGLSSKPTHHLLYKKQTWKRWRLHSWTFAFCSSRNRERQLIDKVFGQLPQARSCRRGGRPGNQVVQRASWNVWQMSFWPRRGSVACFSVSWACFPCF